ncbi:hypothetical protein F2P81_019028 [Scophthalmus maximus]|uniref:Uncharacterized protein n=1 Tax=Scophthalmus maximus TaxID=52904 RepID=A0A6A4S682_SCOMX|nr:hypothetical protein F2P81_019028 [Scophthalmus maximus]
MCDDAKSDFSVEDDSRGPLRSLGDAVIWPHMPTTPRHSIDTVLLRNAISTGPSSSASMKSRARCPVPPPRCVRSPETPGRRSAELPTLSGAVTSAKPIKQQANGGCSPMSWMLLT